MKQGYLLSTDPPGFPSDRSKVDNERVQPACESVSGLTGVGMMAAALSTAPEVYEKRAAGYCIGNPELAARRKLGGIMTTTQIPLEELIVAPAPLDESGYARLARTLRGDVPTIRSIGIITAENPVGKETSERENSQRNIALRGDLLHSFRQVKGKYGKLENPFLLVNIDRDEVIRLGCLHGQAAVIYGQRKPDGEGMIFKLISTSDVVPDQVPSGQVIATCNRFLQQKHDADSPEYKDGTPVTKPKPDETDANLYSEYKGQWFEIPFPPPTASEAEFRGARVLNYRKDEIVIATPKIQEALELFMARDGALVETLRRISQGEHLGGKFLRVRLGDQKLRLIELHQALGNWVPSPMFSWTDTWNPNYHLIRPYSA